MDARDLLKAIHEVGEKYINEMDTDVDLRDLYKDEEIFFMYGTHAFGTIEECDQQSSNDEK